MSEMEKKVLAPEELVGERIAQDRYKILSRLGTGSMGHVFRAFDFRLETEVVVKVPTVSRLRNEGFRNRFLQESRLLIKLDHPHIVRIIAVGEHEQVPFVVMGLLSGGSLEDQMKGPEGRQFALSPESLTVWLREVAKALDYMHNRGIIHRDVKPANILFDETGNAYLSDFGLSKILSKEFEECDPGSTVAGGVVGTPDYVAPELVLGMEFDGRADQYSLGITIYEVLTGFPPMRHSTNSGSGTMVNQTQKKLDLLSEVSEDVSYECATAVARAIAKKPEQRFPTCHEFADAVLDGLASGSRSAPRRNPAAHSTVSDTSGDSAPPPRRRAANSQSRMTSGVRQSHVAKSQVAKSKPGRSRAARSQPGRSHAGRSGRSAVVSRGEPGRVPCPLCEKMLPLKPHHAGRRGKCIQCQSPLRVGPDLKTLTLIQSGGRSPDSSASQSDTAAEEMVLGNKLFGIELSTRAVVTLAVLTIGVVMAAVIYSTITVAVEKEKPEQRFRSTEG